MKSTARLLLGPRHLDLSLVLRGFFSLAVVYWHVYGAYNTTTIPTWVNVPGRVSVWMFFGISGYVIFLGFFTKRYELSIRGTIAFWIRRVGRIFPLFWFLSIFSILTLAINGIPSPIQGWEYLTNFLALKLNHVYALNGVFWTLGIELQFYLVAPVVVWALCFKSPNPSKRLSLLLCLLLLVFGSLLDQRYMIANLQFFLAGGIVALNRSHPAILWVTESLPRTLMVFFLGFALVSLAGTSFHLRLAGWAGASVSSCLAIACLLIAHLGLDRMSIVLPFSMRIFHFFGVLSYGMYAWHGYVLQYIVSTPRHAISIVILTLIGSLTTFFLLEVPSQKAARKLSDRVGRKAEEL